MLPTTPGACKGTGAGCCHAPIKPKMPRMEGAKMTKRLMKVSRTTAMVTWRIQLKSFPWNSICWMARRTWGQGWGVMLHP